MKDQIDYANRSGKEYFFQVILHCLVFIFYAFDNSHPHQGLHLEVYHFVFFLNYTWANAVISYIFLPRFYYQKKYGQFFIYTFAIIGLVIFLEESLLEQIFFADTRGRMFPGIFFSLVQVLPIIVILSGFKFAWDALHKQRELDELRAAIKESELQFLKSQINPHFLFNNLNNLYSYAIENSPKTPTIILELSSVLRYMLYECKEEFVALDKEVDQLKNFIQLYKMQIEDRGEVNFTAENIKPGYQIAPLILIVFVENAFKHSQSNLSENIKIDVKVKLKEDGVLTFHSKNNYQPQSTELTNGRGIGLTNVKQRLNLIYPDNHQLKIEQTDNVYQAFLDINLNLN